jgi:hypothetical protein
MIAELKQDEIAMVSGAGFWDFVSDFGRVVTPFNPIEFIVNNVVNIAPGFVVEKAYIK